VSARLAEGEVLAVVSGCAEADTTNIRIISATIRADLISEPDREIFECLGKAEMILQVVDEILSVFQ
jgi:hypothetical protein